jgi:hypothetical protein
MFAVRAGIGAGQRCPVAAVAGIGTPCRSGAPAADDRRSCVRVRLAPRPDDAMFIAGSSTTDRPLDTQ